MSTTPAKGKTRKELIEGLYRLSSLQQGMLFHGLYDKGAAAYVKHFACELVGADLEIVSKSWQHVMQRHTILRSAFIHDEFTIPVQCVYKQVELPVVLLDYRHMTEDEQASAIKNYEEADLAKGFDFKNPPLMRLALIRLKDDRYLMIWTSHHILFDGWSMPILMEEFLMTYQLLATGKEVLAPEPDRYEDYIRFLERSNKELENKYWRGYLKGLEHSTLLPFVSGNTERTKGMGTYGSVFLQMEEAVTSRVQQYTQKNRLTVNTLMQGVWSLLLKHYTGSNDVVFGTIVSGRPDELPGVEKRVGMYINTLPVRSLIDGDTSTITWLRNLQDEQLSSRNFQHTAFQDILAGTGIQGDLFDSLLVFENYPVSKVISAKQWALKVENVRVREQSNYPLTIIVASAEQISIHFSYNSELLKQGLVQKIRDHFEHVLLQVISNAESSLNEIQVLTRAEKHQLLYEFNDTKTEFPTGKSIVDLFEAQVEKTPAATALIFESEEISYLQLNERSSQLANFLRKQGVKENTLVPFCIERGINMVVSILGIMKAGAAYVPIDPAYPQERISYMLEDINASTILVSNSVKSALNLEGIEHVVDLNEDWNAISHQSNAGNANFSSPDNLAYVIYTSGSTGKPKGVEIEQKALVNLVCSQVKIIGLHEGMSLLQFASFSFDASCSEIFTALTSGSRLILPRMEDLLSPELIIGLIKKHKVDVVTLPHSYQVLIKEGLKNIPVLISAGEPLNANLAKEAQYRGVRVINAYGPTENTVCITMSDQPVLPDGTVTIGKPIDNVQVYILDRELKLVSVGVTGELCVGGAQVARGYLNRPDLTKEKFIENPFSKNPGEKIYRTGDLACWLPDGNIRFLGRVDSQVKLAGHRIECGEIETVLAGHVLIEHAVVVLNDKAATPKITAFYKPRNIVEIWPSIAEFFIYDDIVYRSMYEHTSRNDKYREALQKVIKDKVVLEIGPGPIAVLSRLCIDCGARHVYAVEILEETYLKAKQTLESLGLTDRITLIHSDIREASLPEPIDYCVSEIVGGIGGSEGSAVLIDISKKFLKDPGHMIPSRSLTKIAAITLDDSEFEYGFSDIAYYYAEKIGAEFGKDFEFRLCVKNLPLQNRISSEDVFEDLYYSKELQYELDHEITLTITRDAIFNGFYVWMDLFMDEDIHLDIIDDPESWLPIYFPVAHPGYAVRKGDQVKATISRKLASNNINPDYFIKGLLVRAAGENIPVSFDSYHHKNTGITSPFFRNFFEEGKLKKLPKLDTPNLRQYLGQFLPDYMIPSAFVPLDNIPKTVSGKIDRKALLKLDVESGNLQQYEAPKNEVENKLVALWKETLQLSQVGINDNFFESGGQSLLAMRLISSIRKELRVEVAVKDLFNHPTIAELAAYLQVHNTGLLLPPINVVEPRPALIPLSFSQERLRFIDHLEGSVHYHVPVVLRLQGKLNKAALDHTLQSIIKRHEVLRTLFREINGQPCQYIMSEGHWQLVNIDGAILKDDPDALQQYLHGLVNQPFDLSKDYMLRAALIRMAEEEHVLVATMHHIASDGWSMSILVKEVVELYGAYEEKRPDKLAPLKLQYADFAIWQRAYLQGETLDKKLEYWRNKLEDVSPLQFPADYPRPVVQSNRGNTMPFRIDKEISKQLQLLSQRQGTTLFMTMLSAIKVLLHRYSGQEDICIGTGSAGRPHKDLDGSIGFFVNTFALRSTVSADASFTNLLQQVKTTTLEAYAHEDVPFEKVVDAVVTERDMSRTPVFQVMMSWLNTPDVPDLRLGDLKLTRGSYGQDISKYDLTFTLGESPVGLLGSLEYCTDLFTPQTIERMLAHFKELLNAIVQSPQQSIGSLSMLTPVEEQQLITEFNDNAAVYPTHRSLIELFEEQVAKTPLALAVVYNDDKLTYEELNERSNQLANFLRSKGVKEETLVPICIERSLDMLVGIVGILKAGAAYVPIDPEYPVERISYMLEDTGAALMISNRQNRSSLPVSMNIDIIEIDSEWDLISQHSTADLRINIKPDNLAYVIYTSGSTGKPKGVLVEHKGVVNLVFAQSEAFRLKPRMRTLQFASFGFDASCSEIFNAFLTGGALVLPVKDDLLSADAFEELINKHNVEIVTLPPSYQHIVKDSLGTIKTIVSAGEPLNETVGRYIQSKGVRLINAYGPTENTVCVTISGNPIRDHNSIVIGKPISNVQVYILDKSRNLSPIGSIGEIYIGGAQVARGYLNLPGMTGEKFIADPFSKAPAARMYKTGDLGRWLADGNIEYSGRVDDQVKIRGYRIELGEIEACMSAVNGIVDARVIVSENEAATDKKLNAYLRVDNEKLPLLSNYLNLVKGKAIKKSDLNILPNGLPVLNPNASEVKFLYNEIFEEHSYLKHGITLSSDSCVFDVGANTGFFSIFLNILSEDIKVYSVEPIPEVHQYLVANRQLYNVKGKAFQLAILDKEQEVDFTYYPQVSALSSITQDKSQIDVVRSFIQHTEEGDYLEEEIDSLLAVKLESRQIKCQAKTLSQLIASENIEKIDLLKIDVENSEHLVINGIEEKDWVKIQNIIIEVHDTDGRLEQLKTLMEENGFITMVEKEKMLSQDNVLYNLYAWRAGQEKALSVLGDNENLRAAGWIDPVELVKNIRTEVEAKLPAYMMPAHMVLLDQFPLTRSGKVDKKALPDAEAGEIKAALHASAESAMEKAMAGIWKDLLEIDELSIHDDFFELGGHSLLAVRLVSAIRKELGVELPISDIFDYPTVAMLVGQVEANSQAAVLPAIHVATVRPEHIPLSFSQERLWFIDQLEGSVQYHLPSVLRLKGNLNKDALTYAFQNIVNRHEVLRTTFPEVGGTAYQSVCEKGNWNLEVVDGSAYKEDHKALQRRVHELIIQQFDLAKDHMVRATLTQVGEQDHVLVVIMHHIASDAWSISLLVKEVVELYSAFEQKRPAELSPVQFQYADYAIWQRNYLRGEVLDKKLGYWKNKLEAVAPLQLPTDHPRPAVQSSRGAWAFFSIDKELSGQMQALCQQEGTTLFMALLAAFKILLHRYSGQQDICVGTSIASREQQELEGLIGYFVNTLALRTEVNGSESYKELLQKVRATTLEAYENQEVPFEKIVDAVVKERDMSRNSLFQVMLVLQNTPEVPKMLLGDVELSRESFEHNIAKFDLTFFISDTTHGLQGSVSYCTDLFNEQTIGQMMAHFKELVGAIVAAPTKKVGALKLLSQNEEQQILQGFNNSQVAYPRDKTIVDLFEEQVEKAPAAIALVFEGEELSYQQLNERSNQLANYLKTKGVKKDTLVPVCMERGVDMMIAIMGILKAGGAYVPIDTDFPADRISYMLEDTNAIMAISNIAGSSKLGTTAVEIIELDGSISTIKQEPTSNPPSLARPNHLAYAIYTSGSTGKPKGVMIEHRSLVDYVYGLKQNLPQIKDCQSFALVSTIATDLGNTVIYSALLLGGALHIFSKESVSNTEQLHRYFRTHSIDCLKIVPSHWKALAMEEKLLLPKKLLVFGGEALQAGVIESIRETGTVCQAVNHYGPTETTIGKLLHVVEPQRPYSGTVPIGKPFSNTKAYVLTKDLQLCPVGVAGQLWIAGDGVARGYVNNPALTAEKFIKDPFSKDDHSLMYGTGDLVKWLADGNIQFIGRVDEQVKIRGYRVEPGEIESILKQCELVSQAVVLAKEDKQGGYRLVAYVVADGYYDKDGIIAFLKDKLPDYMIPALIVEVETMPLTANGKVDRKALPDPDASELLTNQHIAPATGSEKSLVRIWEDLLEVEQVGIYDDFFELGGHSLLAVRLVSAIRKEFAVELPISDIFDYPTIALLVAQVETKSDRTILPSVTIATTRPEHIPLSFSQERLWFIDRLEGSVQYHLPSVLRLKGNLNIEALTHALQSIVNRHEVLRTTFPEHEGKAYQTIRNRDKWNVDFIDGSKYKEDQKVLKAHIHQLINRRFDLAKDPMVRAALIALDEKDHVLVVVMHHIASDAWSTSILVKEVVELYTAFEQKRPSILPAVELQYADFSIWQRNYLVGEILDKKLGYWKEKLRGVAPLQLPTDFARPAVQSSRGGWASFKMDKELSSQLQQLCQQEGATLFMGLLSAFKVLLHRYSGQQDICVGTSIASREQQELEGLIGYFVNTLALRTEVNSDNTFNELLQQVRTTTLEAYGHQEVPFEKVVDAVVRDRDTSRRSLFQVMLVLQSTPEVPKMLLGDVELSRESFEHNISKFDLTFFVTDTGNGLQGSVNYCTDLFVESTVIKMIAHFKELLNAVSKAPGKKVGALSMLTQSEEQQILQGFNNSQVAYPRDKTIVDLFEEQVEKAPAAIALVFEGEELSYQQLNERSNQLANYLRTKGVKKDTLVPICMERGLDMMIAIMGILKAGGAYVPIDTDFPADRISYMLEDTNAIIAISTIAASSKLGTTAVEIIELDGSISTIKQEPTSNPPSLAKPNHLAYAIYTSGSTGKPKGVMIEHRSLVDYVYGLKQDVPQINDCKSFALVSTIATDLGNTVIYSSLLLGGALHIFSKESVSNTEQLHRYFRTHAIDCLKIVSSHWKALAMEEKLLLPKKLLVFGGEALQAGVIESIRETGTGCQAVNHYGPTETTIGKLLHVVEPQRQYNGTVPIGKPFSNTKAYVLTKDLQLCPVGVAGQLWIAGDGVARGYVNNPALTAEKFIKDPFSKDDQSLMYGTGDLVKWLADGNIQFIGRVDEQVKIRGYRVEPGEIETILKQCELVSQAVVLAKEDKQGGYRLVAYVVADGYYDKEGIITYLKDKLPDYMIPALIVEVETMPLTANGKVDRKALPDPDASELLTHEYVAPRNDAERALAKIWQEVLGVEQVGIHDDFFELGGHSLLAVRVVYYIERNLLISIPINVVFEFTTISSLIKYLEIELNINADEIDATAVKLVKI